MKTLKVLLFSFSILLLNDVELFSAGKKGLQLPKSISKNLTLKGRKAPYLLNGSMVIEKGAKLTLLPGVIIKGTTASSDIRVHGELNILGKKKSPVKLLNIRNIFFINAKCNLTNFYTTSNFIKFEGSTSGVIKNGSFAPNGYHKHAKVMITAPTSGLLYYENVLFRDKNIVLVKTNLPDSFENLKFNKCAFLLGKTNKKTDKYIIRKMPTEIFAFGTKCDTQMQIGYNAMNWKFKKVTINDWHIYDKGIKETIKGMVKSQKSLKIKFSKKKLSKYSLDKKVK
ncbi:MAG: hypothetical protein COA79_07325 [Planctomycetota bacterium]|nr:MAG: hypothetical protein COA79_07325 [Planctomycetota bacterium]